MRIINLIDNNTLVLVNNTMLLNSAIVLGKGYLQSSHSEVKRFLSMRKTSKTMSASKDSGLDVTKE